MSGQGTIDCVGDGNCFPIGQSSLSNEPPLPERFYELDDFHGPLAWLSDVAVILLCVSVASRWTVLYPLAVLMIGARQRALATLLHDAAHLTLVKTRFLNDLLGAWASGYLIFQSLHAYRFSHVGGHHGKFGTADDPDYVFHLGLGLYGRFGPGQLWRGFVCYARYLVVNRLSLSTVKNGELLKMSVLWLVLIWWAGVENVVLFWLFPMLVSFGPIGYLIEIGEHWPLMRSSRPLYQTRNRASSWIESCLFSIHAENFHLLHHLYPRLPFKSMKEADAHLASIWPDYRVWNDANGGILLSANDAPSLVRQLINASKEEVEQ